MASLIASGTLLINPAFLLEIKESNPDLWESVQRLKSRLQNVKGFDSEATQSSAGRLIRDLEDVRDRLSLQFALEEAYGFIEVPGPGDDATDKLVIQAHQQHCTLYLQASELVESAEELQYRGFAIEGVRGLAAEVAAFLEQLLQHEQLEHRLIDQTLGQRHSDPALRFGLQ